MKSLILLVAALTCGAGPDDWRFVDEVKHGERSVLMFRTIDLADVLPKRLHPDDQPPAGSRFGVLPLGPSGSHRVALVWHSPTGALWIDADGNGRFGQSERHSLAPDGHESKVAIPFGAKENYERTLLIRKRGEGLAYAIRGTIARKLTFGGQSYDVRFVDSDADGCFNNPTTDRLWIDKNRDGQFDPLTEHFVLGRPVEIGNTTYLVQPDPLARTVSVVERPSDMGRLTLNVARLPGAKVVRVEAQLISEWGEWVAINEAEKAISAPVGRYRIQALTLRVADVDGRTWAYSFHGSDRFIVAAKKDEPAVLDATAGLKATMTLRAPAAVRGGTLDLQPAVVTACGLTLGFCERFEKFTEAQVWPEAVVALEAPGSQPLCESRSGFSCFSLCSHLIRVPMEVNDDHLEAVVRFPSGPLAGDLRAGQTVPVTRMK